MIESGDDEGVSSCFFEIGSSLAADYDDLVTNSRQQPANCGSDLERGFLQRNACLGCARMRGKIGEFGRKCAWAGQQNAATGSGRTGRDEGIEMIRLEQDQIVSMNQFRFFDEAENRQDFR